jgi:NADP-dependent 3-hydroxy acid dehydrogenase YdfG
VAAITGAGSGIGRALAEELARRGAHLALSDIDEVGLAETVNRCEGSSVKVSSQRLDVADRTAVFAWADAVVADHGKANLVFNNAGVALIATIDTMSIEDFEWLMNINFWGVVHGTNAFLPHLKASGEGHVVNVSSVFGLLSIPSQAAYNAAKFAVRGFTDALRMELEMSMGQVPADARNGFDKVARTTPEKAALLILDAVERDKRRALIGPDAKALDLLARLPAGVYQRALVKGARSRRRR